jgi:hypothetical protein
MAPTTEAAKVNVEQLSSLSRVVDPRYSSNRLVIAGALVAGAVTALANLSGLDTGLGAVSAAVGVFLAWAIARELDPDYPPSAAVAMPISLVLLLAIGPASLLVSMGVLLGVRLVAGTVGAPLRPLDIIGVVGLAAFLGANLIGVVGLAAMIIGVIVDEPHRKRAIVIAASAATVFACVALISGLERAWTMPDAAGWIAVVVAVVSTVLVLPAPLPTSSTDRHTGVVLRGRVTTARVVAGTAVIAGFGLAGAAGIAALAGTAAAALAGTAIRRIGAGRS